MVYYLSLEKKEVIDKQQALSRKMTSNEKINSEKYDITIANQVSTPSNGALKHHLNNISLSNLNANGIGFKNETSNVGLNNGITTNTNNNVQINQYLKHHIIGNTPTNIQNKFFNNNQFDLNHKISMKNLSSSNTAIQPSNSYFINNKNMIYNFNPKENDQNQLQLAQQGAGNNCENDITTIEEYDDNKLKTDKSSLNETAAHTNSNSTYNVAATDIKSSKRYDTGRTSFTNNFFALGNNPIKKDHNNLDMEVVNNLVYNHNINYLLNDHIK